MTRGREDYLGLNETWDKEKYLNKMKNKMERHNAWNKHIDANHIISITTGNDCIICKEMKQEKDN